MGYKNYTLKEFYTLAVLQVSRSARVETIKDRLSRIEKHIIPSLGDYKIIELTPIIIEEWQNHIYETKGNDQARRCRGILKSVLNRAIFHGVIAVNPVNVIAVIKKPLPKQREIYSVNELKISLKKSKGSLRLFILTMVSLGVRSGEIIVLKFSDIDRINRTIKIARSMRQGEIKETKTGVERLVDIPLSLFVELEEYRVLNPSREYIFVNKNGTTYKDSAYFLRRHFKPLLERLGIKYKSMYSLRHTFATLQLQGGQSINYISKQLGHSSIRTTQDFYIKYLRQEEDLRRTDSILNFS